MSPLLSLRHLVHTVGPFALAIAFLGASAAFAATTAAPTSPVPAQPALAALVAPHLAELNGAGIQKIVARTGKQPLDIQMLTQTGAVYFGWPRNTSPVPLEIEIGQGGVVTVRANDYTEESKPRFAAALEALVPEAVRRAHDAIRAAQRPRA